MFSPTDFFDLSQPDSSLKVILELVTVSSRVSSGRVDHDALMPCTRYSLEASHVHSGVVYGIAAGGRRKPGIGREARIVALKYWCVHSIARF